MARAGHWPSGWSPTGRWCWTCRPSSRPGSGCIPAGMAARPTGTTHCRSAWPPSMGPVSRRWPAMMPPSACGCCGRREELTALRTQAVCRLHRLLAELTPGGMGRELSAGKAQALLAHIQPGDEVAVIRVQIARDHLADIRALDARLRYLAAQIAALVTATGTGLTGLYGIGPVIAGRLLAETGDVARFPTKDAFASYNGTAPIDASSGEQVRHRLSRAGNRRINHALHMMAVTQIRNPGTTGRRYYEGKRAEGKTPKEALRCLKRAAAGRGLPADGGRPPGHNQQVRITYDPAANAVYIHLTSEALTPGRTTIPASLPPGSEGFIALGWKDGRLVGIEILDATRHLHNDLLQTAEIIE
jgi:uncharacterized protein YuzE